AGPGAGKQTIETVAREKIGVGYFAALDEPMLAGRDFNERDQRTAAGGIIPVILNQSAVQGMFEKQNPLGQRITEDKTSYEVIGVIHDLKAGIATGATSSVMYLPLTRRDFASPPPGGMTIMVRSAGGAGADAMAGVRRELAAMDPNLEIFDVKT